jgi:predicted DNA-binding transcriptional regulator AlpA
MATFISIKDFTRDEGIGRGLFNRLIAAGKAPPLTRIGRRVFISQDDVDEWRAAVKGKTTATGEPELTLDEMLRGRVRR